MTQLRTFLRIGLLAASSIASASALASPAAQSRLPQAAIDYANQGGIADWQALDDTSLYLMDRTGRWYRAEFQGGVCYRLPLQNTIAFTTSATGRFDAVSSVVTEDGSCPLKSLVRTDRPAVAGLRGVASATR